MDEGEAVTEAVAGRTRDALLFDGHGCPGRRDRTLRALNSARRSRVDC